jgi:hypothetical protein
LRRRRIARRGNAYGPEWPRAAKPSRTREAGDPDSKSRHHRIMRPLAGLAVLVCVWTTFCFGQIAGPFSIDPAMTKGPATAPVTIVEFSDYQ